MPADDDADDDGRPSGPPLPPDDRLWRHPSELAAAPAPGLTRGETASGRRPRAWPLAMAAALGGAAVATGALAATGALTGDVVERHVIEKVAVTPVVSSPMGPSAPEMTALIDQMAPSVVRLRVDRDGTTTDASGVVFRDDGVLLTGARVVDGATAIEVLLADGRRFDGRLVGADPLTDVAVVDIDATQLPVAVLATSRPLEVGEATVAVGAPSAPGAEPLAASGMVTGLDRSLRTDDGSTLHGLIELHNHARGELAGGPLVDAAGAVVGITTAPAGDEGVGHAVPVELARRVAAQLLAHGHAVHGWLGIEGADLPAEDRTALGLAGGALVEGVVTGSPAEQAGLATGDVITDIDGAEVRSIAALIVALRRCDPGDELVVGYRRQAAAHATTVVVGERPRP